MSDTRPMERLQHSYQHYGKFILKLYGVAAYQEWERKVSGLYFGQERRAHKCSEACKPAEPKATP